MNTPLGVTILLVMVVVAKNMPTFVARELKPFIDKYYRANPDPQFNAIVGSSMGGLISIYIGLKYPDAFGRVGAFSPALWFSPEIFEYVSKHKRKSEQRIYLLAGEKRVTPW